MGKDGLLGADDSAYVTQGVRCLQGLGADDDVSTLVGAQRSCRVSHFKLRALSIGPQDRGDCTGQFVVPLLGANVAAVACAEEGVIAIGVHLSVASWARVSHGGIIDRLEESSRHGNAELGVGQEE